MPVGIQLAIAALIGVAVGILFGWLKWRGKAVRCAAGKRIATAARAARIGTDADARTTFAKQNVARHRAGESGGGGKNSRRAKAASRTNLARRQGRAGKGAGRFARHVQGVERRRAETERAGIFAAGGTVVRQISGNGQGRSGAAAGSHQRLGRAAQAAAWKPTRKICSRAARRNRPRWAR